MLVSPTSQKKERGKNLKKTHTHKTINKLQIKGRVSGTLTMDYEEAVAN